MKSTLACAIAAAMMTITGPAAAQTFPSKPITLLIPYAAGGPIDVTGRLLGDHMSRTLGQPVVLENVGGAGGTTGAIRVARAAPDGHTLLIHQLALAVGGALYPNLPYDSAKDFEPVAMLNYASIIIVARKNLPANNINELKAWGSANPVNFGHAGVGSGAHLCSVLLSTALGLKTNYVAYRGGGPALNDIVAGHLDLFCSSIQTAKPLIDGGQMKGVGVTSPEPSETTPPAESLVKHPLVGEQMNIEFWQLMAAPKGTPPEIIAKLNEAVQKAHADADVAAKFKAAGVRFYTGERATPQFARQLFLKEIDRWTAVVKKHNITLGSN